MDSYTSGKNGNDANHRLKQGCKLAKLSLVESAFSDGASVKALDADSCTPMHWLASSDIMEVAPIRAIYDILIAKGASLSAMDTFGETPINAAAKRGSPITHTLFDDMLERGQIAWVNMRSQDGESTLDGVVASGDEELLVRMLEAGVSPLLSHAERSRGISSAVTVAQTSSGNPRALTRLLVAWGADPADAPKADQYLTPLLASVIVPKRLTELLNASTAQTSSSVPFASIEREASKEGMNESVAICQAFRARLAIQDVARMASQLRP